MYLFNPILEVLGDTLLCLLIAYTVSQNISMLFKIFIFIYFVKNYM